MITLATIVGLICGGMFFIGGPMGVILIGLALIAFGVTNKKEKDD